ncbi:MAG: SH3 domain-containing protein [Oscillospiraceae bacterium]|nr:SH3 domain-containing protein [Oscillospiraceae bacterium]
MKIYNRFVALLTAFVLTVTMFSGCANTASNDTVTEPSTVTSDAEVIEEVTEATTTEEVTTTTEATTAEVTTTTEATTAPATTATTATVATTEETTAAYTVENMSAVMYAKASVNVRSGPSTSYDRIGHLDEGEEVTVTGQASTGWYGISFEGGEGFVSNNYLVSEKPATTTATTTTTTTAATTSATTATTTAATTATTSSDDIRDDALYTPNYTNTTSSSTVTISAGTEYQTIIGFGGMNYPSWNAAGDLTASERETVFGNDEDELGFTILRIHIDPVQSNWSKEVATAKAAYDSGALVVASVWNAPSSMTETYTNSSGKEATRVKSSSYADFAEYLNDFVEYMEGKGIEIYALSFSNEPDLVNSGWLEWTTDEIIDFIVNYSDAIDCKLMTPEAFQYNKTFYDAILNNSAALRRIDIFATHLYGTALSNYKYSLFESKGTGKELWMTEIIEPSGSNGNQYDANDWEYAIGVAESVHNSLVKGNFQAYLWWYIKRYYGPLGEDGEITKRGYCMAQYSKFVRPGYVRVAATEMPATGVSISAYKDDGKLVIVAINNSGKNYAQTFNINGLDFDIGYIEAYTTDEKVSLERTGNISYDGNSFGYVLSKYSVTTFVISEY